MIDISELDLSGVIGNVNANGNGRNLTGFSKETPSPARDLTPAKPRGRQPLYLDVETVPDESRLALFGLDPLTEPKKRTPFGDFAGLLDVNASGVDEVKKFLREHNPDDTTLDTLVKAERAGKKRKGVFEAIDEIRHQEDAIVEARAERQKLLSVTPEFCRIVAIGTARGAGEIKSAVVGQPYPGTEALTEEELLLSLWCAFEECSPIVGFNILSFDLPVILIRSAILGVKATRRIDLRPWGNDCVDLMTARYPKGPARKLKELARIYGFSIPAGDTDGSQVERLWRESPGKLAEYVASDIEVTRSLATFYRGYWY